MPPFNGGVVALVWLALTLALLNLVLRVAVVAIAPPKRRPLDGPPLKTLVVLGSGGHTAEMFALLNALSPKRYAPRTYVLADTDMTSLSKVNAFEAEIGEKYSTIDDTVDDITLERISEHQIVFMPRSREVGQSYITSVFTTLKALIHASTFFFCLKRTEMPDVILVNGPGTCLPTCVASFISRVLGMASPAIIYVESVCRVEKLSLTGLILYNLRLADYVFVQWEELTEKYGRAVYAGRVV